MGIIVVSPFAKAPHLALASTNINSIGLSFLAGVKMRVILKLIREVSLNIYYATNKVTLMYRLDCYVLVQIATDRTICVSVEYRNAV